MHVWLPYVKSGGGADIYTKLLESALKKYGIKVTSTAYPHFFEYNPFLLKFIRPPNNVKFIVATTLNGFVFKRKNCKLIVVEHHCIFDPLYKKIKTLYQKIYHEMIIRYFEKNSLKSSDYLVAVSDYTDKSLQSSFPGYNPKVIYNGIDTDFFCPNNILQDKREKSDSLHKLLFVGNISTRKGADLLPSIMDKLGKNYQLYYTSGLQKRSVLSSHPQMHPLGQLSLYDLRKAYREADLLLFPSRFEGFGYAPVEAMSCGTPVVASRCSALPETIQHGTTGMLCTPDHIDEFARSIQELVTNRRELARMGYRARQSVVSRFNLDRLARDYLEVFEEIV
ncbi:MAG: glycosyltransferase family 4 protein [bacterium]